MKIVGLISIQFGLTYVLLDACRIRPTDAPSVWEHSSSRIKLDQTCGKAPQEFHFDEVLTGSENKPVYNAVARSHVCAAMEGYNAVVFAYGQTASGKTFTLVSPKPKETVLL